jgi:peptidyl-tRNA hydrolase, PTH2 family
MTSEAASPPEAVKQVIVIRQDLGMRRGKEIAQGAHASMAWLTNRIRPAGRLSQLPAPGPHMLTLAIGFSEPEWAWLSGSFTKVVCRVASEPELDAIYVAGLLAGLETQRIIDAGKTEFAGVPTFTAVAIGPDYASKIDAVTGSLQLY